MFPSFLPYMLKELASITKHIFCPLRSRGQGGIWCTRDLLRETCVKDKGEKAGVSRRGEPADHEVSLTPGEGEGEARRLGKKGS